MLLHFFDVPGPILVEWMPKDTIINAVKCVDIFIKLRTNIKNCQKGRVSAGIMLLRDNAKPNMAGLTQLMLTTLKFKVFALLVYIPDLNSFDYVVLSLLKKFLEGKCFFTDEEVKEWMLLVGAEF